MVLHAEDIPNFCLVPGSRYHHHQQSGLWTLKPQIIMEFLKPCLLTTVRGPIGIVVYIFKAHGFGNGPRILLYSLLVQIRNVDICFLVHLFFHFLLLILVIFTYFIITPILSASFFIPLTSTRSHLWLISLFYYPFPFESIP